MVTTHNLLINFRYGAILKNPIWLPKSRKIQYGRKIRKMTFFASIITYLCQLSMLFEHEVKQGIVYDLLIQFSHFLDKEPQ